MSVRVINRPTTYPAYQWLGKASDLDGLDPALWTIVDGVLRTNYNNAVVNLTDWIVEFGGIPFSQGDADFQLTYQIVS